MSSQAQIIANRANAQLSTGAKSAEGKAKSSHNAVDEAAVLSEPKIQARTGLTGATVLLPSDDVAAYERNVASSFAAWQPETDREKVLVQSIADTEWRLLRIPSLESGIYALGRLQYAENFADQPEAIRATLLDAYIFQASRRDLTNLSLQESRLRRQREKDLAELQKLIQERIAKREARLDAAAHMYERFKENEEPFDPKEFGFEFSFDKIEERVGLFEGHRIGCKYSEQFAKIHAKDLREERLAAS
ncbi:MAG TPA: hypothetical protein VH601_02925 [Bryobacteraceae bacterium]|jgi:hypothetical protein